MTNRLGSFKCSAFTWCNNGAARVLVHLETGETRLLCVAHARELQNHERRQWAVCEPVSDFVFKAKKKAASA